MANLNEAVYTTKYATAIGGGKPVSDELFQSGPTVRLVANANQGEDAKAQALGPHVRLVTFDIPAVHSAMAAPSVRLAHQPGSQCDNGTKEGGWNDCGAPVANPVPGLLVSYYYLDPFVANKDRYRYRDWVMDSGAFSAHNSGVKVDLNRYIDKCAELLASDPTLTEVFALDVIGNHEASLRNCEEMWRQGVPAIPCYHIGEPEEALIQMAKDYPKIALGGVALLRGDLKFKWCEQCFARVWPKKIHGFGMSSPELVYGLPFHSVDATNWELAPCAFGNWQKFGAMSVRGSNQDLRSQVKYYLDMEEKARVRWSKEMAQLDNLPPTMPAHGLGLPTVRERAMGAPVKPDAPQTVEKPKPKPATPAEIDSKWAGNWWNK